MGCAAPRLRPHSLITLNRYPILPEPPESFNCRHCQILIVVCQAGLQFPFRTRCDFFLQDEKTVCLHLDLPEIEDVIPETNKEILKSGETRDVRRLKSDRHADYSRLVMGECLFITAEVFSYLPLAQVVQVTAYTQRPRELESSSPAKVAD